MSSRGRDKVVVTREIEVGMRGSCEESKVGGIYCLARYADQTKLLLSITKMKKTVKDLTKLILSAPNAMD